MRMHSMLLVALLGLAAGAVGAEVEAGFVPLFNGRDLDGWEVMGEAAGWKVVDGCIHSDGGMGGQWLRTEGQYGSFVLRLEWMLSKVGNSGILIRTGETGGWVAFEVQLLAPWTPTRDDLHCTGSIYGHVAVDPRPDETPERWRSMEIACRDKIITVSVDGEVCCRSDMDKVASLRDKPLRGCIGLQDSHTGKGQWVKFRNLRLKDLDQDPGFICSLLRSKAPGARRRAEELAAELGAPMVEPLCEHLAQDDPFLAHIAEGALFAVAARATEPGEDDRREAVVEALTSCLEPAADDGVRRQMVNLLGVAAGGDEAIHRLGLALREEALHETARTALERVSDPTATRVLLAALDDPQAGPRPGIVMALGARGDVAAVPTLMDLAVTGAPAVRVAALRTLGQIGDLNAVELLRRAAEGDAAADKKAAVQALIAIADGRREADPALASRLYRLAWANGVDGAQKSAALVGLSAGKAPGMLSLSLAGLGDPGTRRIALNLLQQTPDKRLLPALQAELKAARGGALATLLRLADEREMPGMDDHLIAAAQGDDEAAQAAALAILGRESDPAHAPIFRAAAQREAEAVRQAAAAGLLALADGARGRSEPETARSLYHEVLDLAGQDEARSKAVGGLAQLGGAESQAKLAALLAEPALRDSAATALVAVGEALAKEGKKEQAVEVLTKVVTGQPLLKAGHEAGLRLRELGVTDDFATDLGFVTNWWLIGPLPNADQSAYEKPYFPEQEIALDKGYEVEGKKLRWEAHRETAHVHGMIDLIEIVAEASNVCAYGYAEVTSDRAREAVIRLGTDDGYELWLNGEKLGGTRAGRPLTVDQDTIPVKLKAGPNKLLVKVLQGGSAWRFCLRVTDAEGKALALPQRSAE